MPVVLAFAPFFVDDEAMAKFIAQILEPGDHPKLNEVAAGIGQLLSEPLDNRGNQARRRVLQDLVKI